MKKNIKSQIWKKVLHEIYLIAPNKYVEDEKFNRNTVTHALAKRLKLTSQEFSESISFLEEQKLIQITRFVTANSYQTWEITEKGFNVALENEKADSTEKLQITAGLAATLIAMMSLFNFVYTNLTGPALDAGQKALLFSIIIVIIASGIGLVIMVVPLINKAISYNKYFQDQ